MNENETKVLFPNSPPEPGSGQPARGPSEADQACYLDNEVIDLLSLPSLTRHGGRARTEPVKLGMLGRHMADRLRDSYSTGQDFKADFSFYRGCVKALASETGDIIDVPPTVLSELERLQKALDETRGSLEQEKILREARGLFLQIGPRRR